MGLHILLYRIEGIEEYEDQYPSRLYKTFKTSVPSWWDSTRHGGDKEFDNEIEFASRTDGDDGDPDINKRVYSRPEDLDMAITWVKKNIHEGNQPRLLRVLEDMQKDPNLWFYMSY